MGGILTSLIASFAGKVTRAVFGGGNLENNTKMATIDYITVETTGNATSFGSLTSARYRLGACSSSTRGVFASGETASGFTTIIDYITIATAGNAISFGNLNTPDTAFEMAGCSSATRGLFGGGFSAGDYAGIHYVTIASTGNSLTFGNLTSARRGTTACASPTRGVFGGGFFNLTVMDYVTIATTGNATSFGSLIQGRSYLTACSSPTRGIFAGGLNYNPNDGTIPVTTMDYITIATTGNATYFGGLTAARNQSSGTSSSLRGVFAAGASNTGAQTNNMDYITLATTGNAVSFGTLTARFGLAGLSSGHGGISA